MQRQQFYFSDGPYLQTLQGLYSALAAPEAFIKLMGKAGTGKSSICEKLTQFLQRKDYRVVYFQYAIESPEMLRIILARELELPDVQNFARLLEDSLGTTADKPLILIFDDAHLLTDITLIEIYRLAEIQYGDKRMLNIVLCGEPSLNQRLLNKQEFKSLLLHVSHKFLLQPMGTETTSHFLVSYLEKAGLAGLQMEAAALAYFFKVCKGFPGPALTLCRLLVESRMGQTELTSISKDELVSLIKNSAEAQILPSTQYLDTNRWLVMGPVAAVLVVASLGFLYQQINNPDLTDDAAAAIALAATSDFGQSPFSEILPVQVAAAELNQPVSDSNLALVTAAERGVTAADIVEPEYEIVAVTDVTDTTDNAALVEVEADAGLQPAQQELQPVLAAEATVQVADSDAPSPAALSAVEQIAIDPVVIEENAIEENAIEQDAADRDSSGAVAPPIPALDTTEQAVAESEAVIPEIVEQSVERWVSAWENQTLESYFASYHSDFVPRYQDSVPAWRRNRERVIGNAEWIRLEMSEFQIIGQENGVIEVHFWLAYESPTYRDNTLKKLLLRNAAGSWLIVEEINLEVRS